MDNDLKIIKKIKNFGRKIVFNITYRKIDILEPEDGNNEIKRIIQDGVPSMVARCGATEMRCIKEFIKNGTFSEKIKKEMKQLSGFFPCSDIELKRFCNEYLECICQCDLLALWGVGAESSVIKKHGCKYTKLTALEPYYYFDPWTKYLEGKSVLIIHPFTESIKKQYAVKDKVWGEKAVLPNFKKLSLIKAVQTISTEESDFDSWFDALDYMKREINKVEFDIAIIGAGAYGLPLAAYVKSIGKISIHMAGATQILFGIKGKRWDNNSIVNRFYNEFWVRPLLSETPEKIGNVEGGSYW